MAGPRGCALSTKRWMCRVLIRIQPLLIVCAHAGFDHGGKTFSSCLESALLRQNMITRSYSPSLSACLLSFSVFLSSSHSIVSCPRLHIPPIFLSFPHLFFFFFTPPISFDHLFKENVDFHPWEAFPVCL